MFAVRIRLEIRKDNDTKVPGWDIGSVEVKFHGGRTPSAEDYFEELNSTNSALFREIVSGRTSDHGEFDFNSFFEAQGFGIAALEDGKFDLAAKAISSVKEVPLSGSILEKYNKALDSLSEDQKEKFLASLEQEKTKQRDYKKEYEERKKRNWK